MPHALFVWRCRQYILFTSSALMMSPSWTDVLFFQKGHVSEHETPGKGHQKHNQQQQAVEHIQGEVNKDDETKA